MANRQFIDKQYAFVKGLTWLYGSVSVAAAGAVTLQKWNYPTFGAGPNARTYTAAPTTGGSTSWPGQYAVGSEGVKSVARTGTGLWTVTLQDNYHRLVGLTFFSSFAGGASVVVSIHENTAITNMTSQGGSIIGLTFLSSTTTPADPGSGERITFCLHLQNLTEP